MNINSLNRYVTRDGYLDERLLVRKEPLYQGMNGRYVERFFVSPSESYIFKPVTHPGQEEREAWIYEHILPQLPRVYPEMLARSPKGEPGWVIYEDLGALEHRHDKKTMLQVAALAARWHTLPAAEWEKADLAAPKPPMESMASFLTEREQDVGDILGELSLPPDLLRNLAEWAISFVGSEERVLSHGDLHAGNYALAKEKLYILDWEHVHLNSPLWDLYHLIDMSHPVFPRKIAVTTELREGVLQAYLNKRRYYGKALNPERFVMKYYKFSLVFSLWMGLLIKSDLHHGSVHWTRQQLERQWTECMDSIAGCAAWLCALGDGGMSRQIKPRE
ncbi:phosphotransferase family protein [Paenibacillus caui]|uniref:phosphotransferase family protein n=1 Tax=Paenibacillus caui TaxID=2873927 RepID=UPI001F2C9FB5|nr:phosphotransferase [Paenibacillus caui]